MIFAIVATLSGCAAKYQVTRATNNHLPPRSLDAHVEIIYRGTLPRRPFQILGKVFVEKSYGGWLSRNRDEDIIERLKIAARDLGAEAIIDAHIYANRGGYNSDVKRWAGGLAVAFTDSASQSVAADFVVVVPAMTGSLFAQHEAIRQFVQYELNNKGFYALISEDSLSEATLPQLSGTAVSTVGRGMASYIMLIDYRLPTPDETPDHIVKAVLVSLESREVVWQNKVLLSVGREASPAEENTIHAPNLATIKRGIRKLISPLPDYSASGF